MRPLSSDLWKAGFVLVLYTLVDVLKAGLSQVCVLS